MGDDGHRPHYHLIIVGLPCSERKLVYDTWSKGRIDIEPCGSGSIRYVLSYIDKQVFGADSLYEYYGDFEPPFAHFSKGLGKNWIENNLDKFDMYGKIKFADSGKSYTLTPYYRDKYGFSKKPYITPFQDSVIKFAQDNNLSLPEAYLIRNKLKEQSLQHKQIKAREPLFKCSKYIVQKALNSLKNKGKISDIQQQEFTRALLSPDDLTIMDLQTVTHSYLKELDFNDVIKIKKLYKIN